MGNAKDAAEERRLRRKGDNAKVRAHRRGQSSWTRRQRRPWESIWGCSAVKETLANQYRGKPTKFPGALGLDILFLSLHCSDWRRTCVSWVSRAYFFLFDPCRLGLFLAYCAKGSNKSNFPWIRLPRWPRWEIASYLYGACKHVSEFLKLPSRQCSASRVLEYLLRFSSLPAKRVPVFRVPPIIKNIGHFKQKLHGVSGGMRCGPARRWVQAHLEVRKTSGKRWLRFFNGKSILRDMLSEEFREWDVDKFAEALVLRSLRAVPGVWRLPVWEQTEDINSECFSCLGSWSFQTIIPQRIHTKLYVTMCGILESIHQVRAPPVQWAELEVPLKAAMRHGDVLLADNWEANKAWCVDRQELFLYLTSQLLQDKHTWTFRPGLQERDVCTLLLTKSILGLPSWIRAGYKGIGEVRPACLFLLVKSKCFLDSGVCQCCKVGHSCMRRVIDCSSVPHKMAWRSVCSSNTDSSTPGWTGVRNF